MKIFGMTRTPPLDPCAIAAKNLVDAGEIMNRADDQLGTGITRGGFDRL
jgi:hypothetical protein